MPTSLECSMDKSLLLIGPAAHSPPNPAFPSAKPASWTLRVGCSDSGPNAAWPKPSVFGRTKPAEAGGPAGGTNLQRHTARPHTELDALALGGEVDHDTFRVAHPHSVGAAPRLQARTQRSVLPVQVVDLLQVIHRAARGYRGYPGGADAHAVDPHRITLPLKLERPRTPNESHADCRRTRGERDRGIGDGRLWRRGSRLRACQPRRHNQRDDAEESAGGAHDKVAWRNRWDASVGSQMVPRPCRQRTP